MGRILYSGVSFSSDYRTIGDFYYSLILILITWLRSCLLGFSNVNIPFLPLHTLFLEASQNVQPHTLQEEKQAPPHAGKNIKEFVDFFIVILVVI